ncbi:hypothetical protein [Bradyrhizobium sp. CCBAU 11357]|uniref:hypothetical protein n=1 Tax=Bradyrhizobium sp. CCBAU 11357 TaxID=1630808 RepID=UPI0023022E56|nr:hypothetical protein [Bradyrhizobium sp. CCBAU 11357]
MTKNRRPTIAAELTAELESDPEFMARKRERDVALAARVARHREEQAPIVRDLQAAGIGVNLLSDLLTRSVPYPRAIPVLLKHLGLSYSDPTLETLARILAVPDARHAWPVLVKEYRKAPSSYENGTRRRGAKDGLAVALAATVTSATMDELIALARDRSHGASRLLLLRALRKSRSVAAKQAIEELSSDPDLEKEIASWRKRSAHRPTPPKSDRFH